jgi:hypothetical protein
MFKHACSFTISADSLALSGEQIRPVCENNLSTSVEHGRAGKIRLTMLNNIGSAT